MLEFRHDGVGDDGAVRSDHHPEHTEDVGAREVAERARIEDERVHLSRSGYEGPDSVL